MKKLVHEQKFEKNEKEFHLEVFETESGIEVSVNGVSYYKTHEREEFKHIPPVLHDFVSNHHLDYFDLIKENGKETPHFYLFVDGVEFACDIETIKDEKFLTMRDWTMDAEKIKERMDLKDDFLTMGNQAFENLKSFVKKKDYDFIFSHDGDEYDNVYYLNIPLKDFSEEKVKECIEKWTEYNHVLGEYIK